jgi:hypothetical protein
MAKVAAAIRADAGIVTCSVPWASVFSQACHISHPVVAISRGSRTTIAGREPWCMFTPQPPAARRQAIRALLVMPVGLAAGISAARSAEVFNFRAPCVVIGRRLVPAGQYTASLVFSLRRKIRLRGSLPNLLSVHRMKFTKKLLSSVSNLM